MTIVRLPRQLTPYANNQHTVAIDGGEVFTVILALTEKHPSLKPYLLNKNNKLSSFVNYYFNGKDIRFLKEAPSLKDSDVLEIIPATSGG